jgi:signal peptidase I
MEEPVTIREGAPAVPRLKRWLDLGWSIGMAVVAALLIRAFVLEAFYIPSASMEPTLEPGDFILVNRLLYDFHPPRRGDIIVFPFPRDEHWDFVKRVIGLPGDLIEARNGRVWVNGKRLTEAYLPRPAGGPVTTDLAARQVPPEQLFVLGDNRSASLDSRYWGTVDEHKVIGKAFLIYWSHGPHWWDIRWGRIGHWLP